MTVIIPGTTFKWNGSEWKALSVAETLWLDYQGGDLAPQIVQNGRSRMFVSVADGVVTLREVVGEMGKTTYGLGPVGVPGKVLATVKVAPEDTREE